MNTSKMIQIILTAIDSGSLTKAGEILGYTQSNLTQMTKAFEDEIGFPLLIKTKRGVEPTEECKLLLPTMRKMYNREEIFLQEIDEIRGVRKGTIKIGTFVSTSASWLPPVLKFFRDNYPDIKFEIEESGQDEMEEGLANGILNFAILSEPQNKSLEFIPLLEDPLVVVMPKGHELSKYDSVPVSILGDYPMLLTNRAYDRDVRRVFDTAGIEPNVPYVFKDDFVVLTMVEQGIGLSVLPELIIQRIPGEHEYRMLDPEAYRTLGIGIRSRQSLGPLARLVIKHIREAAK